MSHAKEGDGCSRCWAKAERLSAAGGERVEVEYVVLLDQEHPPVPSAGPEEGGQQRACANDYDPSWWPTDVPPDTTTAMQQSTNVARALRAAMEARSFCAPRLSDPTTDHDLSDDALLAIVEATTWRTTDARP